MLMEDQRRVEEPAGDVKQKTRFVRRFSESSSQHRDDRSGQSSHFFPQMKHFDSVN